MTTEAWAQRPQAANAARIRRASRFVYLICLALPAAPLFAAPAPVEPEPLVPATELAVPVPAEAIPAAAKAPQVAAAQSAGLRGKADAAASATLAALLPHLSRNDGMLLDRSANFAGDMNRLLNDSQPQPAGKLEQVVKSAMGLLGTPYRWGGSGPDGFDCSGLVSYVFRSALGIELPRASRDMAAKSDGKLIASRDELSPGDLVFFGQRGRVNHVGIYVGSGQFLHAPSRGKDVRVDTLASGYWGSRFLQARRVEI